MVDKQRPPKKGEWASARKVIHEDDRDTYRQEGVVVAEPDKNGGYYSMLSPLFPDRPFNGHANDATYIPEENLNPSDRAFKVQYVNKHQNIRE